MTTLNMRCDRCGAMTDSDDARTVRFDTALTHAWKNMYEMKETYDLCDACFREVSYRVRQLLKLSDEEQVVRTIKAKEDPRVLTELERDRLACARLMLVYADEEGMIGSLGWDTLDGRELPRAHMVKLESGVLVGALRVPNAWLGEIEKWTSRLCVCSAGRGGEVYLTSHGTFTGSNGEECEWALVRRSYMFGEASIPETWTGRDWYDGGFDSEEFELSQEDLVAHRVDHFDFRKDKDGHWVKVKRHCYVPKKKEDER